MKASLQKTAFLSSIDEDEDYDPKYFNLKLLKDISLVVNNKGFTPLLLSIDQGSTDIFQLLLSLLIASSSNDSKVMAQSLSLKCENKGENALVKAARLNHLQILKFLLHLILSGSLPLELAMAQDGIT